MNKTAPGHLLPGIEPALLSDLIGIRWLLDIEDLPGVDISEGALQHFLVARDEKGVAGVVGLERSGDVALLRSLVVAAEHMGSGLGRRLMSAADDLATRLQVRSLYLLTTTASSFFEHLGFRRIDREEAPLAIQSTQEFTSLCPASAVLMVKP